MSSTSRQLEGGRIAGLALAAAVLAASACQLLSTGSNQVFSCASDADCGGLSCCSGMCREGLCTGSTTGPGRGSSAGTTSSSSTSSTSSTSGSTTGLGCPTFADQIILQAGAYPNGLAVGDFDGNGLADLAVSSAAGLIVFYSDGGAFASRLLSGGPLGAVVAGDFNGDGRLDLVAADDAGVRLFLNQSDGGFRALEIAVAENNFLAAGELHGDGGLDLVAGNECFTEDAGPCSNLATVVSNLRLLSGADAGEVTTLDAGNDPHWVTVGDLDGDGKPDVVFTVYWEDLISVFFNEGGGRFEAPALYSTGAFAEGVSSNPSVVVAADFNGDGALDLAATLSSVSELIVLVNDGGGGFPSQQTYATTRPCNFNGGPLGLVAADLNGDGQPDLAYTNSNDLSVGVRLNQGACGFGPETLVAVGSYPLVVAAADFNGDGKPDLAVANNLDGTVSILLNTCAR